MKLNSAKTFPSTEKFQNSEQLWFWFLYSRQARNGFVRGYSSSSHRVCELIDVESLVTKLYLSGQLTSQQLAVMKEFGDKRRCPHQHIWQENKKADMWRQAMQTLEAAAFKKGWIE